MTADTPAVACVDCEFADMRNTGRTMLSLGFTLCKSKEKHHFEGLTRLQQCSMFTAAPADRASERRAWLKEQGIAA